MFVLGQDNNPKRDVYLYGSNISPGTGSSAPFGISVNSSGLSTGQLEHSSFEDLSFGNFSGSAIFLQGSTVNANSVNQFLSFRNIAVNSRPANGGPALRIEGANGQIDFVNCLFDGPGPANDQWANIFIGNLSTGTPVTPYSIHFFNLTSQSANVAVQIQGATHLTFIGSHHENLNGGYLFTNENKILSTDVLISNPLFANNVGINHGSGYLVNADQVQNIVLDSPYIAGGPNPAPDAVVTGASAGEVSLRQVFVGNTGQLYSTFAGNLTVNGTVTKFGGSFRIDDPLDPNNKYLSHSFVESPDMKNVYDGIAVLDKKGEAEIILPDWFQALNQDFRYQLSCIGRAAPVYIAEEIRNNRFKIGGGKPGLKVSWQVTGIRHDDFANTHRIHVEETKPKQERGRSSSSPSVMR